MAEYIEREHLLRKFNIDDMMNVNGALISLNDARNVIEKQPAADVAPVVHGRWIRPHWKNSNYCYDCSECGGEATHRDYQWAKDGIYPICPNCGARMDGDAE
jgi:hypothetical protein